MAAGNLTGDAQKAAGPIEQLLGGGDGFEAEGGVGFHDRKLRRIERSGFEQDGIGDSHLADVM